MPQVEILDFFNSVSSDNDLKQHLLNAIGTLSKEDANFKKQLLNTLDMELSDNEKKRDRWFLFSTIKKEAVFQIVLTGILTVVFILIVYLTFRQLTTEPKGIAMSDGHMEM